MVILDLPRTTSARTGIFCIIKNNKSFRNGSQPWAGWPMRLVLERATTRAEVDGIGV